MKLLGEAVSGERVPSRGGTAASGAPIGSTLADGAANNDDNLQLGAAMGALLGDDLAISADVKDRKLNQEKYEKFQVISKLQSERLSSQNVKELKNLQINRNKILNKWRVYMRQVKMGELKQLIEIMKKQNYREVDYQTFKIKNINNDIESLNDQFLTAQRSHFVKMGDLLNIHRKRIYNLQNEFERDLNILKKEFNYEKEYILSYYNRELITLYNNKKEILNKENTLKHEILQKHETEREELRNKNLEDLNVMKISLESEIEDYEKQFDECHDKYIETTEDKNREFKELKEKDLKLSNEIELYMKKIDILTNNLSNMKKKISSNERECNERNNILKREKKEILTYYRQLKNKMNKFRKYNNDRLKNLIFSATKANDSNKKIENLANNIIKSFQIANKLQTENEKILPFGNNQNQNQNQIQIDNDSDNNINNINNINNTNNNQNNNQNQSQDTATSNENTSTSNNLFDETINGDGIGSNVDLMQNFLKKYNYALIDQTKMAEQRKLLEKENKKLKNILKSYLDGITVTEDLVDSSSNTLIMVHSLSPNSKLKNRNKNNNNTSSRLHTSSTSNDSRQTSHRPFRPIMSPQPTNIIEGYQAINAYSRQQISTNIQSFGKN